MEENKKPSNPRMHNPDGQYASEARAEDYVSLRDHFAGLAMQGFMASGAILKISPEDIKADVEIYYMYADAMLKQREL